MRITLRFLLILCLLYPALLELCAQSVQAPDPILARTWGADQGLSAGLIYSVAQTSDGYLWLGTEHGLLRFDGLRFDAISLHGLATGTPVLSLLADSHGVLWMLVPTAKLLRLTPGAREAQSFGLLAGETVLAMAPALDGGLVISTSARGMLRIDGNAVEAFATKVPSLVVTTAQVGPRTLWLGTRGVGLYHWTPDAMLPIGRGTIDYKVNCLLPGHDGRLWVGTDSGLFAWNGQKAKTIQLPSPSKSLEVLSLLEDTDGTVWIGTSQGLLRLSKNKVVWVRHSGRSITALTRDRGGDIWFGDGPSLTRLQQPVAIPLNLPAGIATAGAIAVDPSGRVWFAPISGGLYWIAAGVPHRVNVDGIGRDVVYSIDCRGDEVWLGRRDGGLTRLLMQRNRISAQTWRLQDGLASHSIYAVRALSDGTVWVGSLTGGLSHWVRGHFLHFGVDVVGSDTVSAIEQTQDGTLWFATPTGLVRLRNGSWQRGIAAAELPSPEVLSLAASRGRLVVGTTRGLIGLDATNGHVISLAPAIHESVLGLAVDGYDRLWVSTSDQLLSLSLPPARSTAPPGRLRRYDQRDGLPNPDGVRRTRSLVADSGGSIVLSTVGGLFLIRSFAEPPPVPALAHVVSILADEVSVPLASPVLIPAKTRRTTLDFDALDLRAPEQVRIRYKLDGFDKSWSEPTAAHQVFYTNLGPGTYVFSLLAQNSRGEWNPIPTDVHLQVQSSLSQRLSFRVVCCVLLLLAGVFLYRVRVRAVLRHATVLADERIAERNRIARELHDTLLQGFISVMMHLHVISGRVPESSDVRDSLQQILVMMEHIIEEARLSVQGLRKPEGQVRDLETTLAEAGKTLGVGSRTAYRFNVTGQQRPLHPAVAEELNRIAMEAISNTFRHAHASKLEVQLLYSTKHFELRICDDGDGINAAILAHGKEEHWGVLGMRERAKHIGAQLEIHSGQGRGSVVHLTMAARLAYRSSR